MKRLREDQFRRSRTFISTHARPLDRELAAFYFDERSPANVRALLKAFQNSDGGFGRCLEPDFRLEESSSLATSIALHYAQEIGLPATDLLIQGAIRYLLEVYDETLQRWHAVPYSVNQVPHAPWWSVDEATGRCGVEGTWANPNADILGYLWRYHELVPMSFLQSLSDKAVSELAQLPVKLSLHDFLCYQRLYRYAPEPYRTVVEDKLMKSIRFTVDMNPEQWGNYGAKPLQIVASPASPFADTLDDAIQVNLDYEIEHVNEDGSWSPNWSWFGKYEEDWIRAEIEWKGHLTVQNLKSLYDFGRVETTT
jgi:hypothetical protein